MPVVNAAPLIAIVGPTASGKSNLAMQVARRYRGELICADSRTVYKGMDIGTAKPTANDQAEVPHHLLNVVTPDLQFTAADFKRLALAAIDDIAARGHLPIMVGGTGLYVDSVLFDYQFGAPADSARRRQLAALNVDELQQYCRDNDIELPHNYQNKRHLIRAIELGGLPKLQQSLRPNTLVVGITTDSEKLKQNIQQRAEHMFASGVLKETQQLAQQYGWDSEAMTGNIYRIIKGVVDGEDSEAEAVQKVTASDWSLAKRQLTWLRRNPFIIWGSPKQLLQEIDNWYNSKQRE